MSTLLRRTFLHVTPFAALALAACTRAEKKSKREDEAEVTPGEDLMQEHGVVERILLLYDEAARRIEHNEPVELSSIMAAAGVVRRFVQDYHEKLEESEVFPRLQKMGRELGLIATLLKQHERGRQVTDEIVRLSGGSNHSELARLMRGFARMYRPHAAREDTVLFPAFRSIFSDDQYRELGERFEAKEHSVLGENGFENTVEELARLEATLGIADLAALTQP